MVAPRFIASVRVIALLTMVSRVLGLARDMVFTAVYGTSAVATAFSVAFRIPNLFRRLFGEGALSASFIPVFSQRYHTQGEKSAEAAARQVIGLQVLVLAVLTIVGECVIGGLWLFGAPQPGDVDAERNRLVLLLTAIMLPHVLSVCTTAVLGGMLNVLRNFWIPTLAPILLNVFEVAGVAVAWSLHEKGQLPAIWPVVVGVMAASLVEVLIPWYALRRRGISILPRLGWDDPAVRTVLKLMGPTVLGLAAVQINTLMDMLIAMWFVPRTNGPLILDLAQRLYQLPLGIIGISVATAIFEQMSAEAAHKQIDKLRNTALEGLRLMLFVGLPISAGMYMLTWPLTALLFERGRFTAFDTDLVACTSLFFTLGIWAYMSQHVYARGFYAMQRPQIPARIAVYMVGLNLTLNLVLVHFLHEAGLALSTAVSAYVQLLLLSKAWRDLTGSFAIKGLLVSLAKTGAATAGMVAAIVAARWGLDYGLVHVAAGGATTLLGRIVSHHQFGNAAHVLVSMGVGAVTFWTLAHVLGCPEARSLLEGLGRRRARAKAAVAAPRSTEEAADTAEAAAAKTE